MTLFEAVETGFPRRRPGQARWDSPEEVGLVFVSDAVADDWEVLLPNGKIVSEFAESEESNNLVDFYARRHD